MCCYAVLEAKWSWRIHFDAVCCTGSGAPMYMYCIQDRRKWCMRSPPFVLHHYYILPHGEELSKSPRTEGNTSSPLPENSQVHSCRASRPAGTRHSFRGITALDLYNIPPLRSPDTLYPEDPPPTGIHYKPSLFLYVWSVQSPLLAKRP